MPTLFELKLDLEKKRQEAAAFWDKFPKKKLADGTEATDAPAGAAGEFQERMLDINALQDEFTKQYEAEQFAKDNAEALRKMGEPVGRLGVGGPLKKARVLSLADQFLSSTAFKNRTRAGHVEEVSLGYEDDNEGEFDVKSWMQGIEQKATMTTSADGYPPQVLRTPGVTFSAQRPPQIIDTLPMRPTSQNSLKWMLETVFTNTAASKAETGAAVEATLTYAEQTGPIVRVPVFIPVSEVQLDDEPGLRQIIDDRLILMVKQEMDNQAMTKTGAGTDLTGLLAASGIQSQAKGADPTIDAHLKAIMKIGQKVSGGAMAQANVIYMPGADWQNLALTRTADGIYLLGNPQDMPSPRLWGLPVIPTAVMTQGTSLVADTIGYVTLVLRMGIDIAISDSHGSNFINGILAIRATTRMGLEIRRGAALCKVTGLPA